MILYHGTSARHLKDTLAHGLRPRGTAEGHWSEYPSRPDLVYLTTAYPFFFGYNALEEKDTDDNHILVVEVEGLEPNNMLPDEDFVSQSLAHHKKESFEEFHDDVRDDLEAYAHHWEDSLKGLGNCAHKGEITPDKIRRYCVIDVSKRPEIAMDLTSPSISLMNFQILGDAYKQKVAWMFGDDEEYPVFETMFEMDDANMSPDVRKMVEGRKLFWDKQSKNRDGVVVVDVI